MARYDLVKGKRKIQGMNFSEKEIEHLKKSGYAKKRGVRLVKKK